MRKNIFFAMVIIMIVLLLIIAFGNILGYQQYFVLFYQVNTSATVMILFSGLIGFLIGFFAMLYSHEKNKEKMMQQELDLEGEAPVVTEEKEDAATPAEEKEDEADEPVVEPSDEFDEDDEILG